MGIGLIVHKGLDMFLSLNDLPWAKGSVGHGPVNIKSRKKHFFPFWVDGGPRLPEIILFLKLTCLFQNIHIFCPFFPVDFSLNALGQDFFLFRYRPADDRKIPKASSFT